MNHPEANHPITSRRSFLAAAGVGAAAVVTGRDLLAGTDPASAASLLRSRDGASVKGGVTRFRSRPDLQAPEIVIDKKRSGSLGGLVCTDAHAGPSQQGPLILDQTGRMIWFEPQSAVPTASHRAFNVRVQTYEGKPVLTFWAGAVVGGHGEGTYAIYDTSYRQIATVKAAGAYRGDLHEFLLTDRGTALFTCYGEAIGHVRVAGRTRRQTYWYGVVQEVDVKTGKLIFQWRSDHHIPLSDSYKPLPVSGADPWDYFHVNAISIDPTDQNLIISGRDTWACYKVNRKTGRVIWKLGGRRSDFRMGAGTRFIYQHDVNIHPGGRLTVFDNQGGPPRFGWSKALLFGINESRRTVTLRHSYSHHPQVYSDALGSVQPLSGGNTFVGWGRSTNFTEYTASGKVLFDGHLSPGASSYRAFLVDWKATPTSPPDLAVVRSGTTATVYASWNGATEITHWGVFSGIDASSLTSVGLASVAGFETAITVPDAGKTLAVGAYGSNGKLLATSKALTAP